MLMPLYCFRHGWMEAKGGSRACVVRPYHPHASHCSALAPRFASSGRGVCLRMRSMCTRVGVQERHTQNTRTHRHTHPWPHFPSKCLLILILILQVFHCPQESPTHQLHRIPVSVGRVLCRGERKCGSGRGEDTEKESHGKTVAARRDWKIVSQRSDTVLQRPQRGYQP